MDAKYSLKVLALGFRAFDAKKNYFRVHMLVYLYVVHRQMSTASKVLFGVVNSPEARKPKNPVQHAAQTGYRRNLRSLALYEYKIALSK